MLRTTLLLCLLVTPVAQDPVRPGSARAGIPEHEALFYRAYFTDKELRKPEEALSLYRAFLAAAPDHDLAGQAARYASQILDAAGKKEEASSLRMAHADAIARTLQDGINNSFLDPDARLERFVQRFESESREVAKHRAKIAEIVDLKPGQTVADIGAGTGLFLDLFRKAVGETGRVYAVDISPVMVAHLHRRAAKDPSRRIEVIHCDERSSKLPEGAVDVAFICDTYHHFSHVPETLASIHRGLKPGGQLILLDFRRIEGKSRPWLLSHVRAGQEVFRAEVEAAGFRLVREERAPFLAENYILRFERVER